MSFISTGTGLILPAGAMPPARAGVESGSDDLGFTGLYGFGSYDGTFGGLTGPGGPGTRMSSYGEMIPDPRWADPYELDQMVRVDGKVAAVLQALNLPIRAATTQINAGPGDTGEAAWCRAWMAALQTTPTELIVGQLCGAILYGKALFEIVLEQTPDGKLTPSKIAWRPPHNTMLHRDKADNVDGIVQQLPGTATPVPIPLDRALVYLHNPHLDPRNGQSDLLAAWCVHRLKMAIVNLWSVFLRRTAAPWVTAKVAAQDLGRASALARRVATLRSGGVVGLAGDESADTLDADGQGSANFAAAVGWCDQQISGSVLAQFLELGQSHVGSFALSQDHSDFFTMGREGTVKEIAGSFTQMLGRQVALNFGRNASRPVFAFGPLAEASTDQLVDVFKALATAPTPSALVTGAFLNSLIFRVAGALGLDMQAIQAEAEKPVAQQLAQGVAHAATLAQAVGLG